MNRLIFLAFLTTLGHLDPSPSAPTAWAAVMAPASVAGPAANDAAESWGTDSDVGCIDDCTAPMISPINEE